ncbi:MAG: expansin EXLX1 family cellulose-binding protein [Myxococcota bacterium]
MRLRARFVLAGAFALGCPSSSGDTNEDAAPVEPCADAATFVGEGTYYDFADGSGACGFPPTPDDLMVGAMNMVDFAGSAACGACARVDGPNGSVDVRIVDLCPECAPGDIDLSPQAFERIAPLEDGRVEIQWRYIPCDVEGAVVYHFKDGSNPWWTAVQIRNARHAVETLEVELDGAWVNVPRFDYNYFVREAGMGEGPFSFRVTDVTGEVLVDEGIPLLDDADAQGGAQFATCEP